MRRLALLAAGALLVSCGEQREVAMEGLFIAIGYRPNTEAFREWLEVDDAFQD